MKCVMIIESNIPIGITANIAASLGISLSGVIKGLTGKDLTDKNGRKHRGITNTPIPILTYDKKTIKEIYDTLLSEDDSEIHLIGFNNIAQTSHHYDDYEEKLRQTTPSELEYPGICLYGTKKRVNKLTGNLKMLR